MDTIYALSSGRPPAAIGIVRISGPNAFAAGATLAGSLPMSRRAAVRTLRDADGTLLDRVLTLCFPGPHSATGEDLLEFHCHGGRAVVAAVEAALARCEGLRPAEPGEFTRRALINGRIDLAQAAGLADLLTAETEQQRIAAIGAAEGRLSRAVVGWMDRLLAASARAEMLLDYADEDDVAADAVAVDRLRIDVRTLGGEIVDAASQPTVDRLRDGLRVVIAGPPNSGKSTLLNRLGERDAAIVSAVAGTTRDRIEVPVSRSGIPYILIDTAGLRDKGDDAIETIGMDRAVEALSTADIVLWTGDDPPPSRALWLHMRADEPGRGMMPEDRDLAVRRDDDATLERLWTRIADASALLLPKPDQLPLKRDQQQRMLEAGHALAAVTDDLLIIAEMLRQARRTLGFILGIDATEAMLDSLFHEFCVGK